jgi:hypothetical protein
MKNGKKLLKETLNHWVVGSIPTWCKSFIRANLRAMPMVDTSAAKKFSLPVP